MTARLIETNRGEEAYQPEPLYEVRVGNNETETLMTATEIRKALVDESVGLEVGSTYLPVRGTAQHLRHEERDYLMGSAAQ